MMTRSQTRIAQLEARISELENEKGALTFIITFLRTSDVRTGRQAWDLLVESRNPASEYFEDEDTDEDYYNRDQIPDTEESEECARCKKTFRYYLHDCTCDDCFDFTYFVCKDCEYKMEGCGICGKK